MSVAATYAFLVAAIVAEVIATTALASSDGLTKRVPSIISVICFVAAFWLLAYPLRTMPTASRRRIGRKSRRIERFFEQVILAGITDGSIRPGADARLAMLAVLGMCNAVINWRESDRARDMPRVAAEFACLIANGLVANGKS